MTEPYYTDPTVTIHAGDCLDVLATLPDASVDAVVTDPPYGLEFMGKEWDRPWSGRGDKPAGADMTTGGFAEGNGYANRKTPAYGKPWVAKRCSTCGHTQAGGSPCRCAEPVWVTERQHPAIPMRAFGAWCQLWATECLRVLKPGGHLLAFGGTRTSHRLACAIEDAGFEIRDSIAWLYGSGFPKSLDVSKAIDKAAGAEREVVGPRMRPDGKTQLSARKSMETRGEAWDRPWRSDPDAIARNGMDTAPATPDAERWQGWGTALKPAHEPIVVARKPLAGTVAANVLAHGTGALNVDGCRVGMSDADREAARVPNRDKHGYGHLHDGAGRNGERFEPAPAGRWPANVVLDESQAAALDAQTGALPGGGKTVGVVGKSESWFAERGHVNVDYPDEGGASRFMYVAKAPTDERPRIDGIAHPTTKPLALMRWLVRLVTPPGGTVLEPFAGSGTTVEACILEGFKCVAIEREADYLPLIRQRIHRRRDPVEAVRATGEDAGLFDLLGGEA